MLQQHSQGELELLRYGYGCPLRLKTWGPSALVQRSLQMMAWTPHTGVYMWLKDRAGSPHPWNGWGCTMAAALLISGAFSLHSFSSNPPGLFLSLRFRGKIKSVRKTLVHGTWKSTRLKGSQVRRWETCALDQLSEVSSFQRIMCELHWRKCEKWNEN